MDLYSTPFGVVTVVFFDHGHCPWLFMFKPFGLNILLFVIILVLRM